MKIRIVSGGADISLRSERQIDATETDSGTPKNLGKMRMSELLREFHPTMLKVYKAWQWISL